MTAEDNRLCERLKHLGFAHDHRIKMYGEEFELLGDPFIVAHDVVFVEAVERKSGHRRRVRIPLPIVKMAHDVRKAA